MSTYIPSSLPPYIRIERVSDEKGKFGENHHTSGRVIVQVANDDKTSSHSVTAILRKYDEDIITDEDDVRLWNIPPMSRMRSSCYIPLLTNNKPGYWYLMGFQVDKTFHKLDQPHYLCWLIPSAGDDCFVTTAAYGDPYHPMVCTFRQIRDEVLQKNKAGCCFTKWYYKNGDRLSCLIKGKPLLCAATRAVLSPIAKLYAKHKQIKSVAP